MKKRAAVQQYASDLVGLDIGYGITKAVTIGQQVAFPSVWGHAREIKFKADELAQKYPGDQLSDDDSDWFIGNLAQSQLRVAEILRLRGRTADDELIGNRARVRLMKAALGKLYPGLTNGEAVHLALATGLPVDHMRGANELKAILTGTHKIETDITDFVANISQVYVMPQPYGTIYGQMITGRGELNPCHTFITTGTVDIGTYTTDVALDNNGEYIDSASGSVEMGVSAIHDYIGNAYEADFQKKASLVTIETILQTGCFKIRGEAIDYTRVVHDAIQPLKDSVLTKMNDLWQNGADVDVIYISGGGAQYISKDVISAYPQAKVVEQPHFANALGYLNFALFRRLQTD